LDRLAARPWLVGDLATPGRTLGRRVRWLTVAAILAANVGGTAVVVSFSLYALPKPDGVLDLGVYLWNAGLGLVYLLAALVVGVIWGRRLVEGGRDGIRDWLEEDRPPTPAERLRVLRAPLRIMVVQMVLWGIAVVCFSVLNATFSGLLALGVGLTVALGGLTTSATAYLLAELALRPVASRALATGSTDRHGVPGVASRWLLAWALGTGAPVVGLALVGIVALTRVPIDENTLAITTVVLCGIALLFGALLSILAAYATVHPISSIQRGLARVQDGDFDVQLDVWDSTEMGLLQAGFNDMATGLRERERMRDLFGRHVGTDVARQALAREDVGLGGEECTVAVLFVDLVGSTALAASQPPQQVVELLNRFFAEVVAGVEREGGWINKFQGDAALAIFGTPVEVDDPHGRALRAARALGARLRARVAGVEAAIGVASGVAVAGQVGAERRFEFTVIGDPVNEAARLTELAKGHPGRLLASGDTIRHADLAEAAHWELGETVTLRGRARPTALAHPLAAATR
jgi:adenylate cyclase